MLDTLKKRLANSRAYRWLTSYAYEQGWEDGVGIGYKLAERIAKNEATNDERQRVLDIMSRERARLLAIEEKQWDGYCADTLEQIDLLMLAVGSKEEL
jgi:hypothetical protein